RVVSFGTVAKLIPRISAPTRKMERTPPRWSTGSVLSFTWPGTSLTAIASAISASGSVSRNTEPHQKCSSRIPDQSGPTARRAPPERLAPRPRAPEPRARHTRGGRRTPHPGGEPADDSRHEQNFDRRRPGSEAVRRDRQHHAEDEQQLPAVPVADGAEVEHR